MKEDFLEDIKKAISSTTRAIAEDKEIDVVFEDNLSSTDNKIVLPKIDNNEDLKNLNQLRGLIMRLLGTNITTRKPIYNLNPLVKKIGKFTKF